MSDGPTPRVCGGCTACCFVLGIEDLAKPPHSKCPKLGWRKCGDYEGRPDECRGYSCGWLAGVGRPADRPDRSGVVLASGPGWVQVMEERAGAADGPFAQAVMENAVAAGLRTVVVRRSGLTQLMGKRG